MADAEFERYKHDQARAYLEHVRALSCRTKALSAEVEAQRELADGIKSMGCAGGGGGGVDPDRIAETVARLQDLISRYCVELSAYVDEQQTAHERINSLTRHEHAQALASYYLLGLTWERVCVDMGYTWDGMMKLRRRAVTEFYDVMPVEWRDPRHPAM